MKKVCSLFLCLLVCCGLWPAAAQAATMDTLAIEIAAPAIGGVPSYSASFSDPADPNSYTINTRQMGSWEYCENGVSWFDNSTGKYLQPGELFQEGHAYEFSIGWLTAQSGNEWFDEDAGGTAGSVSATVNGRQATVEGSRKNILVKLAFPALAAPALPVAASVDVTVVPPRAGERPSFAATPTGLCVIDTEASGEGVNGVCWLDVTDGIEVLTERSAFKAGHTYEVQIDVKPAEGYAFDPDTLQASVNGKPVGAEGLSAYEDSAELCYVFPALTAAVEGTPAVANQDILLAEVTIAEPRTGEAASFQAGIPARAPYTVREVYWYWDEEDRPLREGEVFGAAMTYILGVYLAPKEGYRFVEEREGLEGTLNGESTQLRHVGDDGEVLFTRYFTLDPENPFTDVKESDYYYDAVLWAYFHKPQVTNGVDTGRFGPDITVTRGQAMTFLWRAAGCPEPETSKNPFSDIKESDYWYKAILWAVEQGIANGTGNGLYSPNQTCTRAHIITFIYRMAGSPGASPNPNNTWYTDSMDWACSIHLVQGTNQIDVDPLEDCPRSDVVLYLYRQLG